jgi:two-component sensor histidine kinase
MSQSPIRVLYVDDDAGLRRLVTRGLAQHGFTVESAADGHEALARLAGRDIDVVALDHYMPGLDGMETLTALQAMPDPPPVIFVTGVEESSLAVAVLKAGAADYVVKDVQGQFIALLRAAIHAALNSAQLRRAKEAAEAEVRAARDRFEALAKERAMLLREVNHRVGNSLQLIAALLQMQGGTSRSADVQAALVSATSRVMAVAQVHRRLYTSDDVQSISMNQYLAALVEDLGRSSGAGQRALLTFTGEPVEIDPDRAVAVGVIVNELVINAHKYAYPSGDGPIRVTLQRGAPHHVVLAVEDDGCGAEASAPNPVSTGLGKTIVNAMARKLGAEVKRDPSHAGTRITIAFDLTPPVMGSAPGEG